MDFKFDIKRVLRSNSEGLSIILPQNTMKTKEMSEIIDTMGRESSRAQGLGSIITTSIKFFSSSDNKLYIKTDGRQVLGFLKTGYRKLFYTNEIGKIVEMTPLCLLDFYVHESCQRSGFGKELYEFMINNENTLPNKIAIDRPSQKLIAFMRKHYNLSDFIPQNNNFVIFRQFFIQNFQWHANVDENYQRNERVHENYNAASRNLQRFRTHGNEEAKTEFNSTTYGFDSRKKEEKYAEASKKIYAPVPPWATASQFSLPSTTSSQYGSYSQKK